MKTARPPIGGGLFFYRNAPGRPIETIPMGEAPSLDLPRRSAARRIQRWTSSWTCHWPPFSVTA